MSAVMGVARPLARSGWRRCSGARMASVEDEVRRADPLSVNPGQRPGREDEEICTAGRCRCRCRAGVRHRRRSATHLRRRVYPRRGRGLTEDVTARAVRQRLWSSGVPPARRQQGRVKSRHAALRSAYRVMAECRRSATMSADVGGDGVTRPLARSDSATAARGGDGGRDRSATMRAYFVARGGLIRKMWSVARVNDVYSHR